MEAFFIDADRRAIVSWNYEYNDMASKLGGSMCIGQIFPNGDVCYVSDDGLLRPARRAFRIKGRSDGQPMLSNGVLTGRDNHDADAKVGTLPPRFTIAELSREIEFLTIEQALSWFRVRANEPAVVRTVAGGEPEVLSTWGDILLNLEGMPGGYNPDRVFE